MWPTNLFILKVEHFLGQLAILNLVYATALEKNLKKYKCRSLQGRMSQKMSNLAIPVAF